MGVVKMGSDKAISEWSVEAQKYESRKFFFLGLTFFFVIAAYTCTKELKDAIFTFIVGKEYIPYAKFCSMLVLVPAILVYSKLVDSLRRYYLVCFYSASFAILSLLFAYFLGHPVIGLANTQTSPYRLFGWLFYFFIEGFSPFVVSVFWAFANSITNPESAKKRYGFMVSYSKVGGMISAISAWLLLSWKAPDGSMMFSDIVSHQLILYLSAACLSAIPFVIFFLIKTVPGRFLHGYEAVYKTEKEKSKSGEKKVGLLDGLFLLLKYPYVMGIFGMVFFYEVLNTIMSYLRLGIAQAGSVSISGVSAELFKIIFLTHLVGFFISVFGTARLLKWLGEKRCLLLIPGSSGLLVLIFILTGYHAYAFVAAFVGLKAVNYAFSWPVRESLYIPTIKEIKFKSKSWIDAFGSKFAKSTGGGLIATGFFNSCSAGFIGSLLMPMNGIFAIIIGLWVLTAYLLGTRYERAVDHNEVIGVD